MVQQDFFIFESLNIHISLSFFMDSALHFLLIGCARLRVCCTKLRERRRWCDDDDDSPKNKTHDSSRSLSLSLF